MRRYKIEKGDNAQLKSTLGDYVDIVKVEEEPVNNKVMDFETSVLMSLVKTALILQEITGELPRFVYKKPEVLEMIHQIQSYLSTSINDS